MPKPHAPHISNLSVLANQAWNRLISAKQVENAMLRHEIAASWRRSLSFKISPQGNTDTPEFLSSTEIMEKNSLLLHVAQSHMQRLYEMLKGRRSIVMLMNADGYIVSLFGDRKMHSIAESLNVFPGVNNAESLVGTTAPGISLVEGLSLQVRRHEHYCRLYHDWCCSAAPIKSSGKGVVGVINVANVEMGRHPPEILNLVQMTALAIEGEMDYRLLQHDYGRIRYYLNAVIENTSDAVVLLDSTDKLTYASSAARKILGISAKDLLECSARESIANYTGVREALNAGKLWTELQFIAPRKVTVKAQLKQLRTDSLGHAGILGILRKSPQGNGPVPQRGYSFRDFIFSSGSTAKVLEDAINVAGTEHTILIQGESGTGKEVLSQAVHEGSSRRGMPFVAVNCAALPKELIQSELFGYEGGAFTGASRGGKAGKFEQAEGGTLFLDEIGDMPLEAQANLLRVLQEKNVVRIGGSVARKLDVRVIAATNKNLLEEAAAGRFRTDLYYRLSVIILTIPPLRQRREDIWPLVMHFISRIGRREHDGEDIGFSREAKAALLAYDWPGNVRELQNTVTCFLTRMKGKTVSLADLPDHLVAGQGEPLRVDNLQEVEQKTVETAIYKCGGHVSNAARLLGISRATLYRKLKKFDLIEPR